MWILNAFLNALNFPFDAPLARHPAWEVPGGWALGRRVDLVDLFKNEQINLYGRREGGCYKVTLVSDSPVQKYFTVRI